MHRIQAIKANDRTVYFQSDLDLLICVDVKTNNDHHLSGSLSREESRNPFAKGLVSIFNFVI